MNPEVSASPERYSVFLLAQNRLLREALTRVLCKKNISVVGACALSPVSMEQIVAAAPDVLVMDSFVANLPNRELLRGAQRELGQIKIAMIGMDADEQAFMECVREGALGYVLKDASALEVVATVRAVANGEASCPAQLSAALFRYVARQSHHVPSFQVKMRLGLTSREQQLVGLIGRGLTNKEIAGHLQLAEQTVRNHVHRMLRPADKAVARVNVLDWQQIGDNLDQQGSALLQGVLSPDECQALVALYPEDSLFRSRVVMGRHGFGRGEYKYFNYPLPDLIQGLRTALYSRLEPIANCWNTAMEIEFATRTGTTSLFIDVTTQDSSDRRHCSCSTATATSTACIRISTESTSSRYR